jgi:nucleotide-binding universal stress UspA family protein
MSTESTVGRIVVGFDGSPASHEAVSWAIAQARLTGAGIDLVQAWQQPSVYIYHEMLAARDAAEAVLSQAAKDLSVEDVKLRPVFAQGSPASVLCDAGKGADLMVVGSRGRGGFAGLLLGSVSTQCVHHASCPVLVIHSQQTEVDAETPVETASL